MQSSSDIEIIAQGGLSQLREIQHILARGGIAAELLQPPKGKCGS
jgi:hypothetical protein